MEHNVSAYSKRINVPLQTTAVRPVPHQMQQDSSSFAHQLRNRLHQHMLRLHWSQPAHANDFNVPRVLSKRTSAKDARVHRHVRDFNFVPLIRAAALHELASRVVTDSAHEIARLDFLPKPEAFRIVE